MSTTSLDLEIRNLTGIGTWDWNLEKQSTVWSSEAYRIFEIDPESPVAPCLLQVWTLASAMPQQILIASSHWPGIARIVDLDEVLSRQRNVLPVGWATVLQKGP